MPIDDIVLDVEEKMELVVDYFRKETRGIRTGRASVGLVDHIKVEYFGSPTDLRQLAMIATPDASMIIVKPFDPSSLKDIERAILTSDLGITPNADGNVIRLSIPPLSGERRVHLVAQIKKMAEAARVTIRNARREGNKEADRQQKAAEMTEDDAKKGKEDIQELTKTYEEKISKILDTKTKEIEET